MCPAWGGLPLPPRCPNPASSRTEGTYRPRGRERTSSWRSYPRPNGALNQQRRHVLGGRSGWKVAGCGGVAGERGLLQVTIEHVELRVGIVEAQARVGEHAEVHERLVHVLGQEDEAHVEDDVLHEEGVVEDQHIDEEEAHVEHRGQQRRGHVGAQGAQHVQVGRDPGTGHAGDDEGGGGPGVPASSAAVAPGRPARGQLSHPGTPCGSTEAALVSGGETWGRARPPKRAWRGPRTPRCAHTALSIRSAARRATPEVPGGYPAAPMRPARNHGPSQGRRGAHRGSASRASPGGSVSRSARQFLEPHLCLLRLSAHGCSRRVVLRVAFRAPPPERPRAHWPAAPCPRSLARAVWGRALLSPVAGGAGLRVALLVLDSALIPNPIRFFESLSE